jgi:tetratricopeptide (TPR) repeat protein
VLHVAKCAFHKLETEEQDQYLLADIYASTGLLWAHKGFFDRAEPIQTKANAIRACAVPLDHLELSWTEVNMANLMASNGKNQDSLDWQIKALRNRQTAAGDNYAAIKFQGILYQNLGRCKFLLGLFQEAHVWCTMAIAHLLEAKNWAMVA